MNKKRLDHDKWGFTGFPYYQMRIDTDDFHGLAAIISLTDGDYYYWDFPIAGKAPVCGSGMVWLELIPDNQKRVITAKYRAPNDGKEREVSVWYVDVIEDVVTDDDGTLAFIDKYLDVIFTPQGDVKIDDRDQLDDAYATDDITKEQYEVALAESDEIVAALCSDINAIKKTELWCNRLLKHAFKLIEEGRVTLARNAPFKAIFLDIDGVLDTFIPGSYYQNLKRSAVKCLSDIVAATDAKIIVISTWRFGSDFYIERYDPEGTHICERENWKNLIDLFHEFNIDVYDITPSSPELKSRTAEINEYLRTRRDVEAYVILDDCFQDDYSDDEELHERLVYVNCGPSLQESDAKRAIDVLNKQLIRSK